MKPLKNAKKTNSLSSNHFLTKIKSKVVKIQNNKQLLSTSTLANR